MSKKRGDTHECNDDDRGRILAADSFVYDEYRKQKRQKTAEPH